MRGAFVHSHTVNTRRQYLFERCLNTFLDLMLLMLYLSWFECGIVLVMRLSIPILDFMPILT